MVRLQTLKTPMTSIKNKEEMKILARHEWTDEQRAFLQANPHMALLAEAYLNSLDAKIERLKREQRQNPMYWVLWLFGRVSKAH